MPTQLGSDANVVEPMTVSIRRPPWSLLQTQWLDVPIGVDPGHANPTWGVFSEVFEDFLQGVFLHVSRRVDDHSSLGGVMTAVLVENLDVLVSTLGEKEKLGLLFAAADLLIAREALDRPGETDGCERGTRGEGLRSSG